MIIYDEPLNQNEHQVPRRGLNPPSLLLPTSAFQNERNAEQDVAPPPYTPVASAEEGEVTVELGNLRLDVPQSNVVQHTTSPAQNSQIPRNSSEPMNMPEPILVPPPRQRHSQPSDPLGRREVSSAELLPPPQHPSMARRSLGNLNAIRRVPSDNSAPASRRTFSSTENSPTPLLENLTNSGYRGVQDRSQSSGAQRVPTEMRPQQTLHRRRRSRDDVPSPSPSLVSQQPAPISNLRVPRNHNPSNRLLRLSRSAASLSDAIQNDSNPSSISNSTHRNPIGHSPNTPINLVPTQEPTPGRPFLLRSQYTLLYPADFSCWKCANTGYKQFDPLQPCWKCWAKFGNEYVGPITSAKWMAEGEGNSYWEGCVLQKPLPRKLIRPIGEGRRQNLNGGEERQWQSQGRRCCGKRNRGSCHRRCQRQGDVQNTQQARPTNIIDELLEFRQQLLFGRRSGHVDPMIPGRH